MDGRTREFHPGGRPNKGAIIMSRDKAPTPVSLAQEAIANPFRLFGVGELSEILSVSANFMADLRKAGAPFPGNLSRPEWILDWLKEQGNDFTLEKR